MSPPKVSQSGGRRFGALHGVRLGTAAITLSVAVVAPAGVDLPLRTAVLLTAAFLLVTTAAEAIRRLTDHQARALGRGLLLVDGAYIAAVLALSGGPESRLAFLAVGHIVAVTLLTSSRVGLKIALWQSLLLIVGYYLRLGGLLGLDPEVNPSPEAAALLIVAFWGVAVTTSACSALNERELRRPGGVPGSGGHGDRAGAGAETRAGDNPAPPEHRPASRLQQGDLGDADGHRCEGPRLALRG